MGVDIATALARNHLRTFRESRGLTQENLAGQARASRQTILSIEGGKYVPSLELAWKFARTFQCQVEDLFGIAENP